MLVIACHKTDQDKQNEFYSLTQETVMTWLKNNDIKAIDGIGYADNEELYQKRVLAIATKMKEGNYIPVYDFQDNICFDCDVIKAGGLLSTNQELQKACKMPN